MDFSEIVGHEIQIKALKNSINNKSISHSYLFQGEEGLGKRNIALAFSKTLLCEEEKDEPCNRCNSCIKFDGGNHPDFKLLTSEKGIIKSEEVEKVIKAMATTPFQGKRKVFIIEDSHMIRVDIQNKLLKTLEEPPEYMNIIMITSNANKLLPTILSRCQIIKFYPISNSKIIDLLVREYNINEDEAYFISNFSKGSIDKSVELAKSQEFFHRREEGIKILDSLLKGDKIKALTSMDFFNENKDNVEEILDIFLYWLRDLLVYKEVGESSILINKDKIELLREQSFVDLKKINDIIYRIEDTKLNINRNINYGLSIETMLLNI